MTTRLYDLPPAPDFLPGSNGFAADLAHYVLGFIKDHSPLWDQGAWRETFPMHDTSVLPDLDPAVSRIETAIDLGAAGSRCATVGCFAGWTATLAGIPWLVSDAILVDLQTRLDEQVDVLSYVVVEREWLAKALPTVEQAWVVGHLHPRDELLATYRPELDPEKVWVLPVGVVAALLLGIAGVRPSGRGQAWWADPLHLFGGCNTMPELEAIIAAYTHGNILDSYADGTLAARTSAVWAFVAAPE
jgi:hypothetical protein